MKIVAPKDLQRLNCGFIGWQLQTTELLVKNTVSTSITVHLLVSLPTPPPTISATPSISQQPADHRSPCQVDEVHLNHQVSPCQPPRPLTCQPPFPPQ